MFSDNMHYQEMLAEMFADLKQVDSTFRQQENLQEYNQTRKKLKIRPQASYEKFFESKTTAQNNWMVVMSKHPSDTKYKGEPVILPFAYFSSPQGTYVVKPLAAPRGGYKGMVLFLPEVFGQYAEAMALEGVDDLGVVKLFMIHNGSSLMNVDPKHNAIVASCAEGILYGHTTIEGACFFFHSFVANSNLTKDQATAKKHMVSGLENQIVASLNQSDFDKIKYDMMTEVYSRLNEKRA